MRFVVATPDHARRKARRLKTLLSEAGVEAGLTECQATVALALGYASWAEMLRASGGAGSPPDEIAGTEVMIARIERQVSAIAAAHGLPDVLAAGVARALSLTTRGRVPQGPGAVFALVPRPHAAHAGTDEPGQGEAAAWLMQWEESESGGWVRPDGYSVHAGRAEASAYLEAMYAGRQGPAPDCYERPASDLVRVVLPEAHPAVVALRAGKVRLHGADADADACDAAWPEGAGGWVRRKGGQAASATSAGALPAAGSAR